MPDTPPYGSKTRPSEAMVMLEPLTLITGMAAVGAQLHVTADAVELVAAVLGRAASGQLGRPAEAREVVEALAGFTAAFAALTGVVDGMKQRHKAAIDAAQQYYRAN